MNNQSLAAIHEMVPVATRMRSRQEEIDAEMRQIVQHMGSAIGLATEQGSDCMLGISRLRALWPAWLHAHVPNLPEKMARKYMRISQEQLRDNRQCWFALFPPSEENKTSLVECERTPSQAWKITWSLADKLLHVFKDSPIDTWPENQVNLTRRNLEPVARLLWPERFE